MRDVELPARPGWPSRPLSARASSLFEFGNMVLANMDLHRGARPFVDALSQVSGYQVHLAVFNERQAIVIHRVSEGKASGTPLTLIEAAPVHSTRGQFRGNAGDFAIKPPSEEDVKRDGRRRGQGASRTPTVTHGQKAQERVQGHPSTPQATPSTKASTSPAFGISGLQFTIGQDTLSPGKNVVVERQRRQKEI